jgi:rubrerythrin
MTEFHHPSDILRLALEKENDAFKFYSEMAAQSTDPAIRSTLQELAGEEKGHIRKLEFELDRFAQPDN